MQATGLILAGGASRRMGQDKALLQIRDRTLLESVAVALSDVSDELLVIGRSELPSLPVPVVAVPDERPGLGPLGGLLTGLKAAKHEFAVAVSCDLPFLNNKLLRRLLELAPGFDAVVPRVGNQPQPLHAVYAGSIAPSIERLLGRGERSTQALLDVVEVRRMEDDEIDAIDPEHRSFININSPEDLQAMTSHEL